MNLLRWAISFVGAALLAGLVWLFGPLLPPFDDEILRAAVVATLLLVWAGLNLLTELRRRRRDGTLAGGLTAGAAEEAAAVRDKFATALKLLGTRSRGALHEQPWYVLIGPPGAGKTTALLNAGLRFPLADTLGQDALAGVGGTRLCEWWFAEGAVLIDTAGRYTVQDSDPAVDRAGWEAFLDLLRRTRPDQPLNGVIVAISLTDIAQAPEAERQAHAKAIRARLTELAERLGVRLPVYVLFTKADLIAGFTEFFDDLDQAGRAQVWGSTFGLDAEPSAFVPAFAALLERLEVRMFARLAAEKVPARRVRIAQFPSQVASLQLPLAEFLKRTFAGAPAMLRGAYLASGTQEGTPIDRLLGGFARSFGLDQSRIPSVRPGQGRSYFLAKLLSEVVFGEAMLVARNPAAERRRRALRLAGFAGTIAVVLAAGGWLFAVQHGASARIAQAQAALDDYEQAAGGLPLDRVSDADLARLVPLLDQARAIRDGLAGTAPGDWWTLGLSQNEKLAAAGRGLYRHALERVMLPRLLWRLEAQMRGNLNQPDFLYEATRVYLMLGNGGPLDRDLVRAWMALDWQATWPGDAAAPLRADLAHHLDALLAEPLPTVALDGDLVAAARAAFSAVPLAARAYSRLRLSAAAQHLPQWRPTDYLGTVGATLFVRASGKSLSEGIPGLYTVEGFHVVLLPSLAGMASAVASESWVLGTPIDLDPNGPQMQAVRRQMIALYETDYGKLWDTLLADLNVATLRSIPRAAQDLYILASPQSPLRALLTGVAQQLRLSVPPAAPAEAAAPAMPADATAARLATLLGQAPVADAQAERPGHEIDARYASLIAVAGGGPGAPIDEILREIGDVQQQMAKLAAAGAGAAPPLPPATSDPVLLLAASAQHQPQPLARWLRGIGNSALALRSGSSRAQVLAVYTAPGGPAAVCPVALAGHFPFVRGAAADLSLDDFSRLFAPGGLFDGFVNTLLKPYVDSSGSVWKPQAADGRAAPVSAAELAGLQRAASIRDQFFAGGGTSPDIRLDITPLALDRTATSATLQLGGVAITATHESPRATQITWPSPEASARLSFDPSPAGRPATIEEAGPWAMFRLFARGKLTPGPAADRQTLSFQVGERQVSFEIRASAPFNPAALTEFKCPELGGN